MIQAKGIKRSIFVFKRVTILCEYQKNTSCDLFQKPIFLSFLYWELGTEHNLYVPCPEKSKRNAFKY